MRMTSSRATALFLVAALSGSVAAQAADPNTRTLTTEGISFKKPAGWEWQSDIASNIALKKELKVKDQAYTITAEMVFAAEGFVEDTISGIEKKVSASKGDLKDFKVTRGEKFAGAPAALVSFARVRGEKGEEVEDERQYLFRRNGSLYTWTERAHRAVAGAASTAFSAARSAVTWTTKDTAREPKVWSDVGIKFVLPADFEYEKLNLDVPKSSETTTLLHIGTTVTVKGETFYVQCVLAVSRSTNTLDDVERQGKDIFKSLEDIQDYKADSKQSLKGEKALLMTLSGAQPGANRGGGKPSRIRRAVYWVKRKGYLIQWEEVLPAAGNPALDAALKKARDGLSWL
jgi:hypothetical protein